MSWFPNFLNPWAAIIAGIITIPASLILYFSSFTPGDAGVASTLLWRKAIQDLQVNARVSESLRRNLLLLLQLLLLAMLLAGAGAAGVELHAGGGAAGRLSDRSLGVDVGEGCGQGNGHGWMRRNGGRGTGRSLGRKARRWSSRLTIQAETLQPFTRISAARCGKVIDGIEPDRSATATEAAYQLAGCAGGVYS